MSSGDELLDFKALPKIELHAHLSGSISRQCLRHVWLRRKESGETGLEDPLIVMPNGKHDFDLKTFFPLFSSYIYHLVNDAWALTYTTLNVLRDFADDGVVYLELRTTPRSISSSSANISKATYVQIILDAIKQFEAHDSRLRTRLILSIDRRNSLAEALEVVELCQRFHDQGVVGIDLCGDPMKGGIEALSPAFEAAKQIPGLGVTLHFAEAACSGTHEELNLLLSWEPDRIGHVIHVSPEIRQAIINRGRIGLELCLSCNVHAKMISGGFEAHHFGGWWNDRVKGCSPVLCTDDVGVFGSPLSNEYRLVTKHFGLDRKEVCLLARQGIDVIFGGEQDQKRLLDIMW